MSLLLYLLTLIFLITTRNSIETTDKLDLINLFLIKYLTGLFIRYVYIICIINAILYLTSLNVSVTVSSDLNILNHCQKVTTEMLMSFYWQKYLLVKITF